MIKQIQTGIEPIDDLFKATGETGIPPSSIVAIAQEDFDDATRYILFNLIENFLQKYYTCIYITFNKTYTEDIFYNDFDEKIDNRNKLISCIEHLKKNEQLKAYDSGIKVFLRIMDADFCHPNNNQNTINNFIKLKEYYTKKRLDVIEFRDLSKVIDIYERITKKYPTEILFSWHDVPGKDDDKLRVYLKEKYPDIKWEQKPHIQKTDNFTLKIYEGSNSILLRLNKEKTNVKLEINGKERHELIVKNKSGKLNLYDPNKIIIFDNSSWLLESDKEPREIFFKLCKSIDKYTIIFHFFTLSMHDDKTKGKIGDAVDGYIHLKSMKKNIYRPLRSVGIKKMTKVRESSEYTAYKIDEYGFVKSLK
jgi:KaiC/GvpD/RAD55 family RecA-like ATPase